MSLPLPLNQIAFSVIDIEVTDQWWREGLGFLPAGGSRLLMRGPLMAAIQGVPGAATTCWCLLGRNDWAQIEMFQYENPMSRLMPPDFRPNDIGYTRCGVWVENLDNALARLAGLGTLPLAPPAGQPGSRRVCVRNPDGVYVELMEDDPLPEQNRRGRPECPVAIRSVTLSTPDLRKTSDFLERGLGMEETPHTLHLPEHEALWGLSGAACERKVFRDGSGNPSILLEVVHYTNPPGKPRAGDYSVSDQGILNICFGDPASRQGVNAMHERALAAGARQNCRPIHLPIAGCVYVNDPLGFSYEFMWAAPGRGHRDYGFVVTTPDQRPQPANRRIAVSADIDAPPEAVFAAVSDHQGMSRWSALGPVRLVKDGPVDVNGLGAEREIKTSAGAVREQIVAWTPPLGFRYRVIAGGPLTCHQGEIRVTPSGSGSRVEWSLRFRSRIPGLGGLLMAYMRRKLEKMLRRNLKNLLEPPSGGF